MHRELGEGDAFGGGGGIVQYRSELDKKLMKEGTKLVQDKGKCIQK